jgi:hypothetical protein
MTVEIVQAIGVFIVVPICIVAFFGMLMYFTFRKM